MRLRVESYSGYKADEEPRAFTLEGVRYAVLGISDRWYDPSASYFKVRAEDGHTYLLRHDHEDDSWSLVKVFPSNA
jgi:hypothetical protein